MDVFLDTFAEKRFEQIRKSHQSATSAGSAENINISKEFFEVLKSSVNLLNNCITKGANEMKEMEKMINDVEVRMQELFQIIITSTDTNFDDIVVLATAYVKLGLIFVHTTKYKKLDVAEAHFLNCLKLLNEKEINCKIILPVIEAYNELSQIYIKLEQPEKSFTCMNSAMELFLTYTREEDEYLDPIDVRTTLGISGLANSKILLENIYINVLKNLFILYVDKVADKHRFVKCIHNMLNKRIADTITSQSVDCLHWANTSIHLSTYFIYNNRFIEARNHIVAAKYMIDIYRKNVLNTVYQIEIWKNPRRWEKYPALFDNLYERYKEACSHAAEMSGLYEFKLLHLSRNRLLSIGDDKSSDADNSKSQSGLEFQKGLTKYLIFYDLEKDLKNFNCQLTDKPSVSNINDAKRSYKNIKRSFTEVYKHVKNVETLKTVQASTFLVSFEPDKNKQIKLYKQQIKLLENIIYNPQHSDRTNFSNIKLSQIWYDIVIAYSSLLDIETENLLLNGEQLNEASRVEMLSIFRHLQTLISSQFN